MSNNKYSKEFKIGAISLVTEQNYTQIEAANSLGINAKLISRWINEYKKGEEHAFRGKGKLTPEQLELRLLREENKRLKMEKEILKKATAFFAKEMK
jgi:transposase